MITLCQQCKQHEATLTTTIEKIGRRNLCIVCQAAIPPSKRRTHLAWKPQRPGEYRRLKYQLSYEGRNHEGS